MLPFGLGWVQGSDPSKGCPGAVRKTHGPLVFGLCSHLDASVWESAAFCRVLAVIPHTLSPSSCDTLMSYLLASCFQELLTAGNGFVPRACGMLALPRK